ncbi:aspartate-semialdehyde dehydrogenase [Pseudomonas sp. LS44]|uniref:aspartate-semialdehyde dehydrogenase n=1 Tax=Pseudomonas sp. LS44 TaxID=1357074 RepID=UPI00215A124F|nr:aspartate-semialdehyde dehydrogenase [Pseudomonas sp. LS44]UVE19064.1 aspartate-semialdehyde dehydrogenase [Pseudomonas sp. LS44]
MSKSFDIAVIGATGSIGETLVELLEERSFPVGTLHLLASSESAGQSLPFRGKNVRVRTVEDFDFAQVQLVFFAATEAVTLAHASRAHAAGCSIIDLSNGLPSQVPQVVPEANGELLDTLQSPFLIASPSASVAVLATVLAPLRAVLKLQRVNVTACLAVSSLGREGVTELARQTTELLNMRPLEPRYFDRQIAFNLLAQVGSIDEGGYTALEKRLSAELKQVMALPLLKVAATCVQAPVFFGDSLSVSLQCAEVVDVAAVIAVLEAAPGIELIGGNDYPTAVGDAVGQDAVYVGRVRAGLDDATELNLWIASDNVRKGSALNAAQLGELLIKHYL